MQNISSTLPLLFRRCAAFLYDGLLLIALFFIITTAAIALNDGQAIQNLRYKFLLFVIAFLFFDWFWRHGGQTLGMRAWRIQLASTNGEKITVNHTLKRYLTGSLLFGITLLYMLISTDNQALHDRFSNTKIIKYNK